MTDSSESAMDTPDGANPTDTTEGDPDEIQAALAEIRHECRKVAFVYASLDAACVLFGVGFVAGAVGLPVLDTEVAAGSFESVGLPAPDLGTLAAVVSGVVAFLAEFHLRTRKPAAEQFEAANPEVREALRTARDTAQSGQANPMTRALYADVLERLRETSSVGLLNATRLAATVALAFALSLAMVQTAVVGVDLGVGASGTPGSGGQTGGPADQSALPNQTPDLQDGDEVLGEPTDVTAGSENLSAAVSASPGSEGERDWNYDNDASSSEGDAEEVDAQRAGFSSPDRVEDAALVQRYAHQLETNSTDD